MDVSSVSPGSPRGSQQGHLPVASAPHNGLGSRIRTPEVSTTPKVRQREPDNEGGKTRNSNDKSPAPMKISPGAPAVEYRGGTHTGFPNTPRGESGRAFSALHHLRTKGIPR